MLTTLPSQNKGARLVQKVLLHVQTSSVHSCISSLSCEAYADFGGHSKIAVTWARGPGQAHCNKFVVERIDTEKGLTVPLSEQHTIVLHPSYSYHRLEVQVSIYFFKKT